MRKITMMLLKETKNYMVYCQCNDGNTAMEDEDADVLKWYLRKDVFDDMPEMIRVTIEGVS